MRTKMRQCLLVLWALAIPTAGFAEAVGELRNDHLAVRLSERGELEQIENSLASESYDIGEDSFFRFD